jgi:hypothetical protein
LTSRLSVFFGARTRRRVLSLPARAYVGSYLMVGCGGQAAVGTRVSARCGPGGPGLMNPE